jgi:HEAT repeat protein
MPASIRNLDLEAFLRGARAELAAETDSSPVPHVVELHHRETREIFERACLACASPTLEERILGLRILRELGGIPPRFAKEAVPVLLNMIEREPDPAVLQWIVSAIGYQHMSGHRRERLTAESVVLASVLNCADHHDERVRFHVAAALPSLMNEDSPAPDTIQVLLALSADPDADTRWYALSALIDDFGLVGRKDVYRALEERLEDEDDHIARAARRVLDGGPWESRDA